MFQDIRGHVMKYGLPGVIAVLTVAVAWAGAQPATPPTTVQPSPAPTQGTLVPTPQPAPVVAPRPTPLPAGGLVYPGVPAVSDPTVGQPVIPPATFQEPGNMPVVYGGLEYLLMKVRGATIPSNATAVPVGLLSVRFQDVDVNSQGQVVGVRNFVGFTPVSIVNQAIYGTGPTTDFGAQSGLRASLGFWADPDMSFGIDANFFFLANGVDNFAAITSQNRNQFAGDSSFKDRVFQITVDPASGAVTRQLIRETPVLVVREAASALTGSASTGLYSFDVNGRGVFLRIGGMDIGGLTGFRYIAFKDELRLNNSTVLTEPQGITQGIVDVSSLPTSVTVTFRDNTRIWNHFYGAQLGIDADAKFGSFFLYARAKLAIGVQHQVASVNSFTDVINNDPARTSIPSLTSSGGLLAAPGQNGTHRRDRIAFIPEANIRLGYQLTTWLRASIGYDGLYMNHTARVGASTTVNNLTTTVSLGNENQTLNTAQPTFRFRDQDVWVQGVTFGLEAKY